MSESIKVVCRFRGGQEVSSYASHPIMSLNLSLFIYQSEDAWTFDPNGLTVKSPAGKRDPKTFTYDKVLNSDSSQSEAYLEAGRSSVKALLEGFNGTIFAYGQSGSGKTFTMLGPDSVVEAIKEGGADGIPEDVQEMYGLIPRAIGEIFEAINKVNEAGQGSRIELSVQYLEIYNEQVMDLLSATPKTD